MTWNDTEKCPVCGDTKLKVGIINHIIGKGKAELYSWYFSEREDTPHTDYLAENLIVREIKRVQLIKK